MVSFRELMYPPITLDGFQGLRAKQPKRICFGTSHQNALKKNDYSDWAGSLFVPFTETISAFLPWTLFPNTGQHGCYRRGIKSDDEFIAIKTWMDAHADLVFIRSLFNTAVATCEHYTSTGARSPIGELEYAAKFSGDQRAKSKLVGVVKDAFDRLYSEAGIQAVASVPSSKPSLESLPNYLAAQLSAASGLPDITASLSWDGPKGEIKGLKVDEKWHALDAVGLTVDAAASGKNILLIDDMYQSGATAHFVASRLRQAGANELHLLAVSKGKRDTDNT